ncbi:therostasin-like [Mercenaria mercenaria]|uniref:therostasin-like n=1 Tax=Mercenaria mercenaria TaxID=6596 RepID=UPI00234EBDC2|nr:therostasin-like [Mercenaria mercenaria]
MNLFGVLIALSLVAAAVCQSCKDTMECPHKCPDGYHSQCMDMTCKCPAHNCKATTDCPQGNGSGCPSFCTTMCDTNLCICKWPGSRNKQIKH